MIAFLLIPTVVLLGMVCWQFLRRPMLALAILITGTVLFDHYLMGPPGIFARPEFYNNLSITLGIGVLLFNPIEIFLALLGLGWLVRAVSGRLPGRPLLAVSWLALAWLGVVVLAAWWGVQQGGNGKIGLWILRPVVYFLALGFLTYQLVRGPRQVVWLLGAMLGAIAVKAVVTCWMWYGHRYDVRDWECYVSHEDTSFALYALWIVWAGFLLGISERWQRLLLWAVPLLLCAVVFNDRRINFFTLVLGLGLVAVSVPWSALVRRGLWLSAGALLFALYVGVSVISPENAVTRPVKGIITGLQSEAKGKNTDSSSEFRKLERYDLHATIRAYPELGAGLGVKYLQPIPLPKLTFEYMVYIPHNQVLMTHAMMGPAAYFILLFFYLVLFGQLLSFYRRLRTPWHRCLALAAAASVMNWMIVGYYDMQLFFFRNSLFVGVVVALPACLMRWQEEQDAIAGHRQEDSSC